MGRWIISAVLAVLGAAVLVIGCGGQPGEREFKNGIREIERGHLVNGKALLEKSINRRPGSDANAIAYNYLGIASRRLGQVQQAIDAFEESRRLSPGLAGPAYNLAALLYESGDLARATTLFEEAALLDPKDTAALEFLGALYTQGEQWADARRVLAEALNRAPRSAGALTALARVEKLTGGTDRAVELLRKAIEQTPRYAPALFNLAVLYQRDLKDKDRAVSSFKKYLAAAGDDPHVGYARQAVEDLTAPPPAPPPVVTAAPPPRAERTPEKPPAAPPPEPKPKTANDLLKEAEAQAKGGNAEGALTLCLEVAGKAGRARDAALQEQALRQGVTLCPDQARAHLALGQFLFEQKQDEDALKTLKQAVTLDAKLAPAQFALAEAAIRAGENDTALVALRRAVQLEPENAEALWTMAALYDRPLGISDKAAQAYRQFEQRFPGDARVVKARERLNVLEPPSRAVPAPAPPPFLPIAPKQPPPGSVPARRLQIPKTMVRNMHAAVQAYNRGVLYQQQEDWDRAVYYYTRAIENDDSFATAFFNLGTVCWSKGETELAKDAYLRALALQPDLVAARYNLALVHRELREKDAAIEQLKTLIGARPDYARAQLLLGVLYSDDPAAYGQVKEQYQKFLELAPNDPSAGQVRRWLDSH